jgi:hypothetical protein
MNRGEPLPAFPAEPAGQGCDIPCARRAFQSQLTGVAQQRIEPQLKLPYALDRAGDRYLDVRSLSGFELSRARRLPEVDGEDPEWPLGGPLVESA